MEGEEEREGRRGGDLLNQCQTTSYAPMSDCMGRPRPITYSYAYVHVPVGTVIFDTNNHMKRTNFSRQFDKPDLNFQKVYTHSQSSGHIRIQSEIITHIRTALSYTLYFSTLQETCQIQKRQSNCKIAFNMSKLLSKSTGWAIILSKY